ncbi:WD40 repeat domain-containing protein [Streptosporangiaceae bacterium NEAU-GS5]|nr:WD40 repeat domain-containing protein [Streptosporangiaceae bacterium NEAU-GS5]
MTIQGRRVSLGVFVTLLVVAALIGAGSIVWWRLASADRSGPPAPIAQASDSRSPSRPFKIGRPEKLVASVYGNEVTAVAPKPDGTLAIGTDSGGLYLATLPEVRTQKFRKIAKLSLPVTSVAVSGNGQVVAALSSDNERAEIAIYQAGRSAITIHIADAWEADTIALNESGTELAAAAFEVAIYEVATGRRLQKLEFPDVASGISAASSVAFRPNGDIALLSNEGVLTEHLKNGSPGAKFRVCGCESIAQAFDPSAEHAIFRTKYGHLVVMLVDTGEFITDKTIYTASIDYFDLAVDREGRRVLAASPSGRFLLWDLARKRVLARGSSFPKGFLVVAFFDGGHLLLRWPSDTGPGESYWLSSLE